jgi:hypothetical protein
VTLLTLAAGPALAAEAPFARWGQALPDPALAEQRGGFINAEGLKVAVGLESLVRINDEVRSEVALQLPDLTELAKGTANIGARVQVIHNGRGNALPEGFADRMSGLGTVIQNSLDDQVIQNLKAMNIEISGVRSLRNGQLKARINSQIVESLR